jgi:exosortase
MRPKSKRPKASKLSAPTAPTSHDNPLAEGASIAPRQAWLLVSGATMLVAMVWAYWPTIVHMVAQWERQPDYSHGYLVVPLSLVFLWMRRGDLATSAIRPNLWGGVILLFAASLRVAAGVYYLQPLDGWTLPISVAGAVLLLYGWRTLRWSLPSIAFLWFMAPIPYSAERWVSLPLQSLATKLSTATLVCLGQPAIAEGHVILLGEHTLLVEEACSGMRIFVGIFALAFAFVLFSRWSWWQKCLVLLAALPVAIVANVMRIVATGILYQYVSSEAGHRFSHDIAGFVMIPLAAAILWMLLMYLDRLFPQVEDVDQPSHLFRSSVAPNG